MRDTPTATVVALLRRGADDLEQELLDEFEDRFAAPREIAGLSPAEADARILEVSYREPSRA